MSSPVNPRRPYDSARRREQARRAVLAVIDGARRLFLERGRGDDDAGGCP